MRKPARQYFPPEDFVMLLMAGEDALADRFGIDKKLGREVIRCINKGDEEGAKPLLASLRDALAKQSGRDEVYKRTATDHLQVHIEAKKKRGCDPARLRKSPPFWSFLGVFEKSEKEKHRNHQESLRARWEAGDKEALITAAQEGPIGQDVFRVGQGGTKKLTKEEGVQKKRKSDLQVKHDHRALQYFDKAWERWVSKKKELAGRGITDKTTLQKAADNIADKEFSMGGPAKQEARRLFWAEMEKDLEARRL